MSVSVEYPPNYHFGHLAYERMGLHPDRIFQIDAATGEEQSYKSVLERSIRLAQALRVFGLKPGDVVAISGPNHLGICIPFYAALFNGFPIINVDPYFKYDEIRALLDLVKPKIVFCQNEAIDSFTRAAASLSLDIKLVTFNEGDHAMSTFLEKYEPSEVEQDFKVADYDIEKICPFLICTSGTSGKMKVAALKNKAILLKDVFMRQRQDKSSIIKSLVLAPINWISFYFSPTAAAATGSIMLVTSKFDNYIFDVGHVIDVINKYKPEKALFNPALIAGLIARKNEVDMSSFLTITITGAKLFLDVRQEFKKLLSENCMLVELYGQTEMIGPVLGSSPLGSVGSCGRPIDMYTVKLVDPDTGAEIKEPNVTGELYVKGPCFSGYYNDPEETANSFTEDGFYKTGDLLYRDENNNYFYVDRVKTLIKVRGIHVYPLDIEEVIQEHPGVADVCVVGIYAPIVGQKPAACVVRREGSNVTAQEIKDLVASKLSENQQLQGGVLFLDSLPYTSTGKILRVKLREMAMAAERE